MNEGASERGGAEEKKNADLIQFHATVNGLTNHVHLYNTCIIHSRYTSVYMLMRDAEGRKKEASKVTQTKQHNTPEAVAFLKKDELPRV